MRGKASKKVVALGALSKVMLVLLTMHWWVIPVVTPEEQSILRDANVLDTSISTYFTFDQATRNFMISPNNFRFVIQTDYTDNTADGSAEFTIDLGMP